MTLPGIQEPHETELPVNAEITPSTPYLPSMKLKLNFLRFAAAVALLLAFAQPASAQRVTVPADGDLLLGVRVPNPPNPNTPVPPEAEFTYIINIGNDSTFRNATPNSTIQLNTIGSVGADLAALYGANWHTRTDLRWSIVGARNTVNPPLYASRPQVPVGTPATPFPKLFREARVSTKNQIFSVIDTYEKLPPTANSPRAAVQTNAPVTGSYKWQIADNTTAFGTQSLWTGLEGGSSLGLVATALDLFRVSGNNTDGETVGRVGTFTIDSSGLITFTAPPAINGIRVQQINYTVAENANTVTLRFTRFGDISAASTAIYSIANGTATAGVDYTAPNDFNLSFPATVASVDVPIAVLNRPGFFLPRSFTATIQSATGGFTLEDPKTTTVTITDVDPDPGSIAFFAPETSASTADNTINVVLQRNTPGGGAPSGAVQISVNATGGTLVNGTDFSLASPTIVSFADGETSKSISIALSTNTPGTIDLTLGNPTGNARIGTRSTSVVNVLGAVGRFSFGATQFAALRESGLANLQVIRTGGKTGAVSVLISTTDGTAKAPTDYTAVTNQVVNFADGVDSVIVPVTLTAPRPNQSNKTFTAALSSPTGGATLNPTNTTATTIIVEADTARPSVTVSTPRANAKILESNGPAVTVTGTARDNKGFVAKVEVSLNGGAFVEAPFTLTGVIANYSLLITAQRGINTLVVRSVDFRNNQSTPVTLSFIYDDPFPGVTGRFTGLVSAKSPTLPSHSTEGLITVNTTATGSLSGTITIDGFVLKFTGSIANNGTILFGKTRTSTVDLIRRNKPNLTLALAIDLAKTGNTHKVTGTLTEVGSGNASDISADRALYTNRRNPVAPLRNPSADLFAKPYTALFDARAPGSAGVPSTASAFPQGDGFATIVVSNAGVAKIAGTLADGTAFTFSAPLSLANRFPYYVPLYRNAGSISGELKFDNLTTTDVDGDTLYWFRPAQPTSKVYAAGWPTGISTDLIGSKYTKATRTDIASVVPGLGAVNLTAGNASLTFSAGQLAANVVKLVSIDAKNKATNAPVAGDRSYNLTIVGGTGLFSGSFTHNPQGTKPAFRGAILQKTQRTSGFFLSIANRTNLTSESGAFVLTPVP